MMQSTISQSECTETLLVLHRVTTFFTDGDNDKLMALHKTFLTQASPMPRLNGFIGLSIYSIHLDISWQKSVRF